MDGDVGKIKLNQEVILFAEAAESGSVDTPTSHGRGQAQRDDCSGECGAGFPTDSVDEVNHDEHDEGARCDGKQERIATAEEGGEHECADNRHRDDEADERARASPRADRHHGYSCDDEPRDDGYFALVIVERVSHAAIVGGVAGHADLVALTEVGVARLVGRLNERAFPLVRATCDVDNRAGTGARGCGGLAWCVVERPADAGGSACCFSCHGDGSVGNVLGEGRRFLEGLIDAGWGV